MSGKSPRRGTPSPAPGATRPLRSRSSRSDRSESPGHYEWKNNAERLKTGAQPGGRDLGKSKSESARSSGGQTPRSSQKTPRSGAKTPRTPRSRTPRSSTPTSGISDDGAAARLPLYMQPTHASINKSRKPPAKSATFHARGSSEEGGTRRGAGARQDSRSPVTVKSWTSGNTPKVKTQPKRPNSASSEPAIVGEGIIPRGHIGGRASPLDTASNGTISTPPPSPSADSSQDRVIDEPMKRTSPVKAKPPPLKLSLDTAAEAGSTTPRKSPKRSPLAKKSPPTPTGAKTPPARTPAAASPTKSPPLASPATSSSEPAAAPPLAPVVTTTSKSSNSGNLGSASPHKGRAGMSPSKSPPKSPSKSPPKSPSKSPSARSPRPKPKMPFKEDDPEVSIQEAVSGKELMPKPAPVCEVVPAEEEEIELAPRPPRAQEQQNKSEAEAEKGGGVVKKVKKFFGCLSPVDVATFE